MKLFEQAQFAWRQLQQRQLLDAADSSIIGISFEQLEKNLQVLQQAFEHDHILHAVAIKTQPHPHVLRQIVHSGMGLEAASFEEVKRAIDAGLAPERLVYDSPIKTRLEIRQCHEHFKGMQLNCNCLQELQRMPDKPSFRLGLRINPMISVSAQKLFDVSDENSKFGVPVEAQADIIRAVSEYPISCLHVHAGSQIENLQLLVQAIGKVLELAQKINQQLATGSGNRHITTIDIGGGLKAFAEHQKNARQMFTYAALLKKQLPALWSEFQLVTEFGQWLHANTGFVISRIEYCLERRQKKILFVHVGADLFLRQAYASGTDYEFRLIDRAGNEKQGPLMTYDIAGPLCFAGDYIAKQVQLPEVAEGDQLVILATGANTYALWSRHCSRDVPKMVAVWPSRQRLEVLSPRMPIAF